MTSVSGVYELVMIATTFLTVATLVIYLLRRRQLTSERVIKRLEMHMLLFRSVFIVSIAALLFFIFHEFLEILNFFNYYQLPFNELYLFVKFSMFSLILCSFILNLKLLRMILGGTE